MHVGASDERSVTTLRPQYWVALVTLLLSLGLTALAWRATTSYVDNLAKSRFDARVSEAHATLTSHLVAHAQALRGAQAYVGATGQPSRHDWLRLYETVRFEENHPGFMGIAYLQAFTQKERVKALNFLKQSHPDFAIRPPGERDRYAVVSAFEPATPHNRKAIGADSWSNDERRRTLESARDSGETRITGKITLVMDKAAENRPGFLMYQAVYRNGSLPGTQEDRQKNLIGFVVAPFRIAALTEQMYRANKIDIALRIIDIANSSGDPLFHATHPELDFSKAKHQQILPVNIGGRIWNVHYASLPSFNAANDSEQPQRLLAAGLLISLLLFVIVWSITSTRARAIRMAQRMTRSLRDNETKLRELFAQAPLAIWTVDHEGRILECNDKLPDYVGSTREKIIGLSMLDDVKDQSLSEPIRRAIAGETVAFEGPYTATTGNRSSIYQFHFQPVTLEGEFAFVLAFAEDISARKLAEAHVEHMAHHDALTGLANRMLLNDRLKHAITNAQRRRRAQALLFIDLDHFKTVNDTVGHSAGDALLLEVAQRLRECVRESDTLARIGGDEFVILLTNLVRPDDSTRVAEKVIAAIGLPISVENHMFNITASVGIAVWPGDGADAETLMRNADVAMYHAKNSGRNNYQFFTPEMNARAFEAMIMEAALSKALQRDEFLLHYQPQIDFRSGRIVGAESLIRWQHPELGLVPPGKFIPIAEERGLIGKLGDWVLHAACRQAMIWQKAGIPLVPIAVNISALQFKEGALRDSVLSALKETGLAPEYLVLEITESVVMDDAEQAITVLRELREMGIAIEIDDFGTGYSSLSYLKRLPIHRLKIDQSFVRDLTTDQDDAAIIGAIINMAKSLKLEIIAEGVETQAQAAFLDAQGCQAMQGFLFSRPQAADEFAGTLARQVISLENL
jgi:diguanylate cyclase (GGDEF)-like protein/PAS domain S-box-containing protein